MVPGGGLYIGNLNGVHCHYEMKPSIYEKFVWVQKKYKLVASQKKWTHVIILSFNICDERHHYIYKMSTMK
jgi:hypothetical protein